MLASVKNLAIEIPGYLTEADVPQSSAEMKTYVMSTDEAVCNLVISAVDKSEPMPYNDRAEAIAIIRRKSGSTHGLIEADNGLTYGCHRYVYTVSKTQTEGGIQYSVLAMVEFDGAHVLVTGISVEKGNVKRHEAVRKFAAKKGWIGKDGEGWSADPYDSAYDNCFTPDISEYAFYDKKFPDHALSCLRRTLAYIIENN